MLPPGPHCFPLNLFSLPEGFPLTHTVWWECLQLRTCLLSEVFSAVFIATQQATRWLKTRNVYLLAPDSVGVSGAASSWPGFAGPVCVSVVSRQVVGWVRTASPTHLVVSRLSARVKGRPGHVPLIRQESQPQAACCSGGVPRMGRAEPQGFLRPGLGTGHPRSRLILLVKASRQAGPNSRDGKRTSTPGGRSCKVLYPFLRSTRWPSSPSGTLLISQHVKILDP